MEQLQSIMELVQSTKAIIYDRLDLYDDSESVKRLLEEILGGLVAIATELEELGEKI